MTHKTPTVQVRDLSIGYTFKKKKTPVAQSINAAIYSGELTCLLGANGTGKSTLLRTLSGFQSKLAGQILIQGKEISHYTPKELAGLISVVLTEKPDVKNMTAGELIALGRSPYTDFWGTLSKEDEAAVSQAVARVNIAHLIGRQVHTLSDGEYQKVMIAKALAQQTPIVLLDEPTAFLDFPSKVETMQLLHRLSRQADKTIFLSTHDLELALQTADKLWLMAQQTGIHTGTPEDLALNGSFDRFFDRKGIVLDPDTGLFRIENEHVRQVQLTGCGRLSGMIRKALSRNGIAAVSQADAGCYRIEAVEDSIILYPPNGASSLAFVSIEELLAEIV